MQQAYSGQANGQDSSWQMVTGRLMAATAECTPSSLPLCLPTGPTTIDHRSRMFYRHLTAPKNYNINAPMCLRHRQTHWNIHKLTHTRLTALCPGLTGWAGKEKPIWILLKQETLSGSGISWAICKSAPRSRQITMPAPHHSVFYRPDALPADQPTASKHWRQVHKLSHLLIDNTECFITDETDSQN